MPIPNWLKGGRRVAGAVLAVAVAGALASAPMAAFATVEAADDQTVATVTTPAETSESAQAEQEQLLAESTDAAGTPDKAADAAVPQGPAAENQESNEPVPPVPGPTAQETPFGPEASRAPPSEGSETAKPDAPAFATEGKPAAKPVAEPGKQISTKAAAGGIVSPFAAAGGCPETVPDATVKGRIVAAGSGAAVGGFKLSIYCSAAVATDADGRFSIPITTGPYNTLHASGNDALGYDAMYLSDSGFVLNRSSSWPDTRVLDVAKGGTLDLGNLALPAKTDGILTGEIAVPAALPSASSMSVTAIDSVGKLYSTRLDVVPGKTVTWTKAVPAGDYKIQLSDGNPFLELWWKDSATKESAVSVHVDAGQKVAGLNGSPMLAPGISGTVTDTANKPLRDVQVRASLASDANGWDSHYGYSDQAGKFTITGLALNAAYVVEFAPQTGLNQFYKNATTRADAQPITITAAQAQVTGIDAKIQPGATLSGTITAKAGGVVDPSGSVQLLNVLDSNANVASAAVEAGRYTIKDVAPGTYIVGFYPDSGAPSFYGNTTQASKATRISIGAGDIAARTGIDIVTGLGGSIAGTVTAPAGVSPEGAIAELYAADDLRSALEKAAVGADGKFSFPSLATNNYAVAIRSGTSMLVERWFGTDGTSENATAISVSDDTVFNGVNVTLKAGGVIAGSLTRITTESEWDFINIVDSTETNISNAVNLGWWESGTLSKQWRSRVLEPGTYAAALSNYPSDVWWKDAKDFSSASKITVTAGQTVSGIDFVKPSDRSSISGTVTAPAGLEIESAYVSLVTAEYGYQQDGATLASDGSFTITTQNTGDYKLQVSGMLKSGHPFTAWYGDTSELAKAKVLNIPDVNTVISDLSITVQQVFPYSFTVTDAVTGKPITGAHVNLSSATTGSEFGQTNVDGTHLGATGGTGEYNYTIERYGYLRTSGSVDIKAGQPNANSVQLSPSAKLSGTVTSSNNEVPLSNVWVRASRLDGSSVDTAYTYSGTYSFESLAPGTYKLEFYNYDGLYVAEWHKDATSFETATAVTVGPEGAVVDAQLDLGGVVSGTIVDANGDPVAYAQVGLAKKPTTGFFAKLGRMVGLASDSGPGELLGIVTQTDSEGNYRLPPLAAGDYALYIQSASNQTTWYNGKTTLAEADTFTVNTGGTTVISTAVLPLAEGESPREPEETLSGAFVITKQPANITAAVGDWVTFTALASGDPKPTVQWECSTDGTSWIPIAGETNTSLYLADINDASCKNYRAVFTQGANKLTSEVATLTLLAPATVPAQPDAPVASELTRTQAKLSWTAADDGGTPVTGYVINLFAGGTEPVRTIQAGNVLELAISGLSPETSYQATVTAVNGEGDSTPSDAGAFTTKSVVVPGAPADVVANVASPTSLNVTWSPPTDDGGATVADYEVTVYRGSAVANGPTLSKGAMSVVVSGLAPETDYTVQVKAVNAKGAGSAAISAVVRTPEVAPEQTVPDAPAKPAAELVGTNSVSVTWVAPADGHAPITGYSVALLGADGATISTQNSDANARNIVFAGLKPGMSYTAVVKAVNSVGTSASSPASDAVAVPAQKPGTLAVPTLKSATEHSLELSWLPPASDGGSAVTGYRVTVLAADVQEGAEPTVVDVADPKQLSVQLKGLNADTAYSVSVSACNIVGCGDAASAVLRTLVGDTEPGIDPTPTPKPTPKPTLTPGPSAGSSSIPTTEESKSAVSATVTIAPPLASKGTSGSQAELSDTGANVQGVLGGAGLLLLIATGLLIVARRRVGGQH